VVSMSKVCIPSRSQMPRLTQRFSNEIHNFVAIFKNDTDLEKEDWKTPADVSALLERYSDFHPSILAVLK